jgi:hypothetical protein
MRHFATESGKSKGQFYTPGRGVSDHGQGHRRRRGDQRQADDLRPDVRLGLAAAQGPRRGQERHRPRPGPVRPGDGQRHEGARPDEHDPARLPHGRDLAGQHARLRTSRSPRRGRSRPSTSWSPTRRSRPRRGPTASTRPTTSTVASRSACHRQKNGDYAFAVARPRQPEEHRQGRDHSPAWRAVPRRRRSKHPPRDRPARIHEGHHRPAGEPVLRHRHPSVHPGARQGRRPGRKGIFMVDASKGFIKDGNKNRLRAQDIHKIVDAFTRQLELPRYSRMVPLSEISDPKNDFNLNLPRYIDTSEPEDIQDIDGHLRGGIPDRDLDALERYWKVFPACGRRCSRKPTAPATPGSGSRAGRSKAPSSNTPSSLPGARRPRSCFAKWRTERRHGSTQSRKATRPRRSSTS